MNTTRKRRGSQGMVLPADYPDGGRPDCGVIAVAVAASVPYCKAWRTLRAVKDVSGRWKGRTTHIDRAMAMKRLGRAYPKPIALERGMTVKTFMADYAVPEYRYWIEAGRHIATCMKDAGKLLIVDNMTKDQHDRFLRCHVKKVWRLH